MNTVAIIQARISSMRLPGKVLIDICGKPMLWYVVKRTKWAKHINKVVVATSTESFDNPIVDFCKKYKIGYFRGDLEDVLSRYYHCARKYKADVIVRVTADCPLIDGTLIDRGLATLRKSKTDYLSNTVVRTFPRGFDFEIFKFSALNKAYRNTKEDPEKEHVTPYIWRNHPEKFKIGQLKRRGDKSGYRITVDTWEDFKVVKELIEKFSAHEKNAEEIIEILDKHPELVKINKNIDQKHYGQ